MKIMILALFLAPAPDDLRLSASGGMMTLSGSLEVPDGTIVRIQVERVRRRWDEKAGRFYEVVSAAKRRPLRARVMKSRFRLKMKPGVPGRYQVTVSRDDRNLRVRVFPWGSSSSLLKTTARRIDRLREIRVLAGGLLDHIEGIIETGRKAKWSSRKPFAKKLAPGIEFLNGADDMDLTASVGRLRYVFTQLYNAQAWKYEPISSDDEAPEKPGWWQENGLTVEKLREAIDSVEAMIESELRLSVLSRLLTELDHPERARKTATQARSLLPPSDLVEAVIAMTEENREEVRHALAAETDSRLRRIEP